jgi:hypothetical protein
MRRRAWERRAASTISRVWIERESETEAIAYQGAGRKRTTVCQLSVPARTSGKSINVRLVAGHAIILL